MPMRRQRGICLFLPKVGHSIGMIKPKTTIQEIKQRIQSLSGTRMKVKVELGRNKSIEFIGTLSGIYPALFAITPDEKDFLGKTVYSYSDVLCGAVKLKKIG